MLSGVSNSLTGSVATYSLGRLEFPPFLRWMADYCERANVPLNFAVIGSTRGQGVPLPCPPPDPPPHVGVAGRLLHTAFDHMRDAIVDLFLLGPR